MNMKKMFAAAFALCMMCAVMPFSEKYVPETVISASAEDGTYENLAYTKSGDAVTISACSEKPKGELVIPAAIEGLPVTNIGEWVFKDCSGLTSVVIPDSVTTLGEGAFSGCSGLTSVVLPDSITNIGDGAFFGCSGLISVTLPNHITSIRGGTFSDCTSLTSVTIPESVASIQGWAFSNCSSLTDITIKNPECNIYDHNSTICNGQDERWNYYFNGTITGYENSTAQNYAEKYGYQFESLGPAPEPELDPGDVNGDGKVSILDVISVNRAVLGKDTFTKMQVKAVDFNQNGRPDSEESLTMVKFIVGLIPSLTA